MIHIMLISSPYHIRIYAGQLFLSLLDPFEQFLPSPFIQITAHIYNYELYCHPYLENIIKDYFRKINIKNIIIIQVQIRH